MTERAIATVLAAGLSGLVFALAGCGAEGDRATGSRASLTISGLFPEFDPARTSYVSRCGRGADPIRAHTGEGATVTIGSAEPSTGAIEVDAGVAPGEDFPIAVRDKDIRQTYRVRCLPADFPGWKFERLRPIDSGLFVVSFRPSRDARPWVIVFDHEGAPRWWYTPHTRALWGQVLEDGTVSWARSFGDGYGLDPRMAHEVRTVSGRLIRTVRTKGEIVDGHEFRELGDGNVLVDTYAPGTRVDLGRFGGPQSASAVFAEIQEIDPEGRVVWRWNSRRHVGLEETGRWWRNVLSNSKRTEGVRTFDPVHVNSIEPRGRDEVVVSMRHTDAIYGIERSTGNIVWKLGGTETPQSLRVVGDPAEKLFGGQHDARIDENGDLSVYDNGKDRPRRPRVVSYRLDLERDTATYLGQLNDPRVETSHCCGSARPLPRGGWLVSWGDNPLVTAFDRSERVAFRLHLPVSTFRAVPVADDATTLAALDRGLEGMERAPESRRSSGRRRPSPAG